MNIKKIATATVLSVALIGTTLMAPAPAFAKHKWGHFAAGVGLGLLLGGAARQRAYRAPVYVAPVRVYGALPQAHYNYCFSIAPNTYDPNTNTYIPALYSPRVICYSQWVR